MKSLQILLFLTYSFSWLNANAQKASLPVDEKSGKTVYTGIVQVGATGSKELYARALNWFKTYFPNPSSVLKEQDTINGKISGQHGLYIFKTLDKGEQFKVGQVKYSIEIQVKDGRYQYQIDDIFKLASPKVYIEEWLDVSSPDKEAQSGYVNQVDTHIKEVISKLKEAINQPIKKDAEEDW